MRLNHVTSRFILLWSLLAVLIAAGVAPIGCASRDQSQAAHSGKRIILLTNGNSPFWDACRAGLKAAAADLKLADAKIEAVFEVNDGKPQGQIEKLRQFASQPDVVGIAVSAVDAGNLAVAEEMRNLMSKGVKVICVDGDVDRSRFRDVRTYYIGTDNMTGGRVLGTAAARLLDARKVKSGSYAQFVGRTGSHNAIERMGGFTEAVGKQFTQADRMGDNFDRSKARDNVRNAITNHPDLVALVGIWSYNAPAIVDVIKQDHNNDRDRFTVVTFDAEPIAIKQMMPTVQDGVEVKGYIDAMVVQDPYDMGYQAVRLLASMVRGDEKVAKDMFPHQGQPDGDLYETGLKVVVPDKDTPLKPEMFHEKFGDRVTFMTLSQFQKWLDKYHLQGS